MEFENFEHLYKEICKIKNWSEENVEHFRDLDICMTHIKNTNKMTYSGTLLDYDKFEHSDKLPHDFERGGEKYILFFQFDLELISLMKHNSDKYLNKWKLKNLEDAISLGWKQYCKTFIQKCLKMK